MVRVPTIDLDSDDDDPLADLMRACANGIGMEEYVYIEKEIVFVESVTDDQMQRIIPYYLYCIVFLREVCSPAKNKRKIEDCTLYTVELKIPHIVAISTMFVFDTCSLHKCITCIFFLSVNFDAAIFTFVITLEEVRTTEILLHHSKNLITLTSRITKFKLS